jgi:hypothetical protein
MLITVSGENSSTLRMRWAELKSCLGVAFVNAARALKNCDSPLSGVLLAWRSVSRELDGIGGEVTARRVGLASAKNLLKMRPTSLLIATPD